MFQKSFLISLDCVECKWTCSINICEVEMKCKNDLCKLFHSSKKDEISPMWSCKNRNYLKFNGILTDTVNVEEYEALIVKFSFHFKEPNMKDFSESVTVSYEEFQNHDEMFFVHKSAKIYLFLKFRILVIKEIEDFDLNLSNFHQKSVHKNDQYPLLIGHRGLGKNNSSIKQENTIKSFNRCAELNMPYCELDVHFTKDEQLIVYHDFYLHSEDQPNDQTNEFRQLTRDEIYKKLLHSVSDHSTTGFHNPDSLCPTLDEVMQYVVPQMGLFIELKYPQLVEPHQSEEQMIGQIDPYFLRGVRENQTRGNDSRLYYFAKNYFVDKILKCIFTNLQAKPRNIMLLSFDPDISLLLKRKQNVLPVFQLTRGKLYLESDTYNHLDDRMNTIDAAFQWCFFCGLNGIITRYLDHVKENIKSRKSSGKLVYCYGDIPADKSIINECRYLGIDGLIVDDVEHFIKTIGYPF